MKNILLLLFFLSISFSALSQASGNNRMARTPRYRHDESSSSDKEAFTFPKANLPVQGIRNDSTITISANVLFNKTADSYTAILGISQMGESIEAAHGLINERIQNLTTSLGLQGIKKESIYIDIISQVPVFETEVEKKLFSKTYNEKPIGFEIRKNIHIPITDISKLDDIIASAAKEEIYDIVKVEFYVRNIEAVYDTLRSEAVRIIQEKQKTFEKLGIKPSPTFHIVGEAYYSTYPEDHYQEYKSFSSSSLTQKQTGVSYSKIKSTTEPVSYYYEKTSYAGFDKIHNPELVAPAAQFIYTLTVQYVIKRQ